VAASFHAATAEPNQIEAGLFGARRSTHWSLSCGTAHCAKACLQLRQRVKGLAKLTANEVSEHSVFHGEQVCVLVVVHVMLGCVVDCSETVAMRPGNRADSPFHALIRQRPTQRKAGECPDTVDQARGKGGAPFPAGNLPDGGSGGPARVVPGDSGRDWAAAIGKRYVRMKAERVKNAGEHRVPQRRCPCIRTEKRVGDPKWWPQSHGTRKTEH
jgi:hypothetical protein